MKNTIIICCFLLTLSVYSQNEQKYSAVNSALFLYTVDDVHVNPPIKYNNGKNIISPDPTHYPWEAKLENGMPNVIMDNNGNLAIYISCFLVHSEVPYSKVGAFVYTNNTSDINNWKRPDAGLYWYNSAGKTVDEKISPVPGTGFQSSNIVAVDIESVGIYDDYETTNKPIKLIYLPQRESDNKMLAGYEMDRSFTSSGILSDFSKMKNDRKTQQKEFVFKFINGDTHMNYLKQNGKYYFVSRVNAKRSSLKAGETLPFTTDPRVRYRRETITEVGSSLVSKNVDFNIILDMSDSKWEPYSVQPFKLPGFEKDIWWGIVTAFGTRADETVANRQRTELAVSCDGITWKYLKPGVPFLDNGTDPQSDDHGCINMAKPVINTKFAPTSSPLDMYYFYAASRQLHVSERNSGISLAIGKYGKMAGLYAGQTEKIFYSMNPVLNPDVEVNDMPKFSISNAFRHGTEFYPYILGDITDDPRGKTLSQMTSYVALTLYAYDSTKAHGQGTYLGGTLGSSHQGTTVISDDYEAVGFTKGGIEGNSKNGILNFLRDYSKAHPTVIVSIKDFPDIPVVLEGRVKNATFYGVKFKDNANSNHFVLDVTATSEFKKNDYWSYAPTDPQHPCHTESFSNLKELPNQKLPVNRETGSIALKVTPQSSTNLQTIMRMYGDDNNNITLYYNPSGNLQYAMQKDGTLFASMVIYPPTGKTFSGHETIITVEAVKKADQKYGKTATSEEVLTFRVSCPAIGVNSTVQQPILWNWKHSAGSITPSDSANARAFAYLDFASFVAGMDKITVGGKNENCDVPFLGSISRVEVAEKLPTGKSDFWTEPGNNSMQEATGNKEVFSNNTISVYPNPVRKGESLFVQINAPMDTSVEIWLSDLSGKKIWERKYALISGNGKKSCDLYGLLPGFYTLLVKAGSICTVQKILIVE